MRPHDTCIETTTLGEAARGEQSWMCGPRCLKAAESRAQFRIYAVPFARDEPIGITCDRAGCGWTAEVTDFVGLAELNRRAEEHAEVCR